MTIDQRDFLTDMFQCYTRIIAYEQEIMAKKLELNRRKRFGPPARQSESDRTVEKNDLDIMYEEFRQYINLTSIIMLHDFPYARRMIAGH